MNLKFNKKVFYLLLWCLITPLSLFAQNLKFNHLTVDNGLSQNSVNKIIQDHKGVIWICTGDGLNKYDGYDFVIYRKDSNNPKSLNDNRVNTVFEDKSNHLWIGTTTGLSYFDKDKDEFIPYLLKSSKGYTVKSIVEDNSGNLFLGTNFGLKFFDRKRKVINDIKLNNDDKIQSLSIDKDNLWIGNNSGLVIYSFKNHQLVNSYKQLTQRFKNIRINAIKHEADGTVWIATEANGVARYSKNGRIKFITDKEGLLSNTVRDLLIVKNKEVWVGTKFGLSIFNKETNKIQNYTYKENGAPERTLSQSSVHNLFEDRTGNIWIGTYSGGVNLIYNFSQNFIYKGHGLNDPSKLSNKEINSISEEEDGSVWLATDVGGLNYWKREVNSIDVYKYAPNQSAYNTIKNIHQDQKNKNILWLGTGSGILKFDKRKKDFQQFDLFQKVIPAYIHEYTFENSKNGIWIGTDFDGLYLVENDKKIKQYDRSTNKNLLLNSNFISALEDDQGKGLWIGNRSDGLNYLDYRTNKITSYVSEKDNPYSLSNNGILSLYQDSKQRLWIGTDGGGLNYYDKATNQFLIINKSNGLGNNTVQAITEDEAGAIWISTNKGLFRIKVNVNHQPLKFQNLEIVNYTAKDGLQSNQFSQHSVFKGLNHELFFGGINGLTIFSPQSISKNMDKPNIIFTELSVLDKLVKVDHNSVLDKPIDEQETLILPFDQAYFTLRFSLLNYIYPEKNKYAYVLDGLSNDKWHYVNGQRQATYTNLKPGNYTFKLKAANNSGVWIDEPRTLSIIILPPWYQTWWAYAIYTFVFLALLYLFYYYTKYTERLKNKVVYETYIAKQEQELAQKKLSFFINISHEIKTPITMIMAPLQKLLNANQNNEAWSQYLNSMNKSGQRLLNLIDQLLDFRKLDAGETNLKAAKGNMVRFIREIVIISNSLANSKNIDLSFTTSHQSLEVWFDRDKMEKVIYNILSNAIKYTPNFGKIVVSLDLNKLNKEVIISITDNGCGISEDKLPFIFEPFIHHDSALNNVSGTGIGLAFAKELIDLHHGKINVTSTPALKNEFGYTCFEINLPLGKSYLLESEIDDQYLQTENIDNYKDLPQIKQSSFEEIKKKIKQNHTADKLVMLIVEDNEEVLQFLGDNFKDEFEVISAANGLTGLEIALANIPDIIVSDVMMPGMNGIEFCSRIKEDINTSHIPLILLTARSPLLFKLEGLENGADEYISKPFNLNLLEVKVWNLIGNRQKMRSRFQKEVFLEPTNTVISTVDDLLIEKIIKYIEDHIDEEGLSVEELSDYVGMSRGNLYKKLKALTAKSPVEFIRYIRLKRASQLLKQYKVYINEVALMVGFQDINYFRKCFKEEFGVSPTDFAKQFKNIEEKVI